MPPFAVRFQRWLAQARTDPALRQAAPGWAASLLLHGLGLAILLFLFLHRPALKPEPPIRFVPVDLVALGPQTSAPPAPIKAPAPQQKATRGPAAAPKPHGEAPHGKAPPTDSFAARLKNLSKLRQPDSDLTIDTQGNSAQTATTDGVAAGPALYSVRDYIRTQVLRRWNLDLAALGDRHIIIALRVRLTAHGAIDSVTIENMAAHKKDKVYQDIAISARNALILSAPFPIPETMGKLDFTLTLNPRDTLR